MVQPKLSSHQVKLADLWLRERTHLENQLMACRTDMERELGRTERRIKKVVSWMSDRSREKEARRDELEGQRMVCERLRDELGMMREVRRLRDEERERHEVVERQRRLAREREADRAEAERRHFVAFMKLSMLCNCAWRFKQFNIDHREISECRDAHRELQALL